MLKDLSIGFGLTLLLTQGAGAQEQQEPRIESKARQSLTADDPEILVIGVSPLLGTGLNSDKVSNVTRSIRAPELLRRGNPSLTGVLNDEIGGVNLNDTIGNANQPDFQFRGFEASPVEGTPQGIAVYQSGVRVNEPFGDTVNWDLIPAFAINAVDVTSTNPVYGFNALGGAVAVEMKDGFVFDQLEADASGGSYGRKTAILQYGHAWDNLSLYLGGSAENDNGWRRMSPSQTRKLYSDLGYKSGASNLHLSFTGADNTMVGVGPTPVPLLSVDRKAGLSYPQSIENHLAFVNLHGSTEISKTVSVQASLYSRNFNQTLLDGNPTDAQPCAAPLDPSQICDVDDATNAQVLVYDQHGNPIPASAVGAYPGEIDYARTSTKSLGATAQATVIEPLGDHANHLVFGATVDRGLTKFRSGANLGSFNNFDVVMGTGLDMTGGIIQPVSVNSTNVYSGAYLTDTFDVTSSLALTASARYNDAAIRLHDQLGGDLGGDHHYHRLNPSAGFAYKIVPAVTWFGNYAESNRAPTAAELTCADPSQSCSLASFFIADPDLKQVVSKTFETGLRGGWKGSTTGAWHWQADLFRTDNTDDIIEVASTTVGKGYFQNAGKTRRQGVELSASYLDSAWHVNADYAYIQATFQSALALESPFNPAADANGEIYVKQGDRLPSIPLQRFKLSVDYALVPAWTIGTLVTSASSQVLRGDESNQNPGLGGYTVVNFHTSFRIVQNLELWASLDNAFDRHYETFGTFTNASGIPLAAFPNGIGNTRTVSPGAPREAFAGVRYTL